MQAYQAGVAALRISLKGITVERAENLVDQIQEVRDFYKRVSVCKCEFLHHRALLVTLLSSCFFFPFLAVV